jgi:hypothetical protein
MSSVPIDARGIVWNWTNSWREYVQFLNIENLSLNNIVNMEYGQVNMEWGFMYELGN